MVSKKRKLKVTAMINTLGDEIRKSLSSIVGERMSERTLDRIRTVIGGINAQELKVWTDPKDKRIVHASAKIYLKHPRRSQ